MIIPNKLNPGDEVRVIAPSTSLAIMKQEDLEIAKGRFAELGLKLSFSANAFVDNGGFSASVEKKLSDLHQAFADKNVKMVLCGVGGFNAIEMLPKIDYELIRNNPKLFGGFSDISLLNLAITRKTGMVTYHSPTFSNFAEVEGFDYTLEYFKATFFESELETIKILPSSQWCNDPYYLGQDGRRFEKNTGNYILQDGQAEGVLIGGNVSTIRLLYGTDFMPQFGDKSLILYIEDDSEVNKEFTMLEFNRNFESIILQPWFQRVKAILIGRFEKAGEVKLEELKKTLLGKKLNLPIVANLDFGHTTPLFTLPVGLKAKLDTSKVEGILEISLK